MEEAQKVAHKFLSCMYLTHSVAVSTRRPLTYLLPFFAVIALDNLPAEIRFIMEEIRIKDEEVVGG